jgi:hypothetical protein
MFSPSTIKWGRASIIAALCCVFSLGIRAQSGWEYLNETPERVLGLLDLPDIVQGGCGPETKRAAARVFSTPSNNGSVVGTINWREEGDRSCRVMIERSGGKSEQVPTLESGYEIPAAIVFERRGAWFRIRLMAGSGWIRRSDPKDFLPYPEILAENLVHTLESWDGSLRATPGVTGAMVPLSAGWKGLLDRQLSVEYLGSRRVGNDRWLHIRLAAKAACDQTYEGVNDVSGWIPAYHPSGSPSLWFSSRGC